MTPAEIREYLGSRRRIIVVTNGPAGLPHPVPMNYGLDDQGRILITSFRKSQKIRNLERDPRAALLAESGETYAELKSVIAYADAEIITDPETVASLLPCLLAAPEMTGSLSQSMGEQVRDSIAKRVIVRFTPWRYVSWDHAKLDGFY